MKSHAVLCSSGYDYVIVILYMDEYDTP